jgi:hypothetical protein
MAQDVLANDYKVNTDTVDSNVPIGSDPFSCDWENDIEISWNATNENPKDNDRLLEFYYKWSESEIGLGDELSKTNNDGSIDAISKPYGEATANATLFQERGYNDEDSLVYLHVKTYYFDSNINENVLSNDAIIGPINIDNVAPTGTVQLVDDEGTSIESTTQTTVNLQLSASVNPQYYYIQEDSSSSPNQGVDQYLYNSTVEYTLADSEPGEKKVFVWFEDAVGNISYGNFASDEFELLGDVYISPNDATIDISQSAFKDFYIEGATENYNWSVINQSTENVAQISTNSTNATSITLEGLNPGTCQLQAAPAEPESEYDALTSGTITVQEGFAKGDADGNGKINSTDALYILHFVAGNISINTLKGECDIDDSGNIVSTDALYVLHYVAGNISSFN